MKGKCLVWFRQDLRIHDNPALQAAAAGGKTVVPVYIWAPEEEGRWAPGGASRWWLHHSLISLNANLTKLGAPLVIRSTNSLTALKDLIEETGADSVFWNDRYEPICMQRDEKVKHDLRQMGIQVRTFNGTLLFQHHEIVTKSGAPYKMFTAFWNRCSEAMVAPPLPPPQRLIGADAPVSTLDVANLGLLPTIPWDEGIREQWSPGEPQALQKLDEFLDETINEYDIARNIPGDDGTSRFSPHLHFGELSVRQAWHAIQTQLLTSRKTYGFDPSSARVFLRELGWREFAYYILINFPDTAESPMQSAFAQLPEAIDTAALRAWHQGETGYPIVDAGMRQLWRTGWMHNRVRMITASFLTKHLLQPWQAGASWFWDTLVDADLANNSMGWQWVAGSGVDAAPFFRIFNPVLQGQKFDPDGVYVRKWIPEIAGLSNKVIHAPWTATSEQRRLAGLGNGDYPIPMVDHALARSRALDAFARIRTQRAV